MQRPVLVSSSKYLLFISYTPLCKYNDIKLTSYDTEPDYLFKLVVDYITCGRENKSCVVYNRGEILVDSGLSLQ